MSIRAFFSFLVAGSLLCASNVSAENREATLFLGSSSIAMWSTLHTDFPRLQPINLGRGGSHYADLIRELPVQLRRHSHARQFVIYSGDNDIAAGLPPTIVAENFRQTIDLILQYQPRAHIFVIAIKPCLEPKRRARLNEVAQTNKLIAKQIEKWEGVRFVDIFPPMLNAQGGPRSELFLADGVHLNADGYALWRKMLLAAILSHPF